MTGFKKTVLLIVALAIAGLGVWQGLRIQPGAPAPQTMPAVPSAAPSMAPDLSAPPPGIHIATPDLALPSREVREPAIRGTVVDSAGAPIEDAAVAVYEPETGAHRTFSDASGAFAVGDLEALEYRVSAQKAHYNDAVLPAVHTGSAPVELVLTDRSTAGGRVTDEAGRPIAEFEVACLPQPPDGDALWKEMAASRQTQWETFSDPEGQFELSDVPSGAPFAVGARAAGFEPGYVVSPAAEPGAAAQPVEIRLMAEARITGRVLAPDQSPVAGAMVHQGKDADAPAAAESDVDGNFEIAGLGDGEYVLTASHESYLASTAHVLLRRGAATPVDIVLGQGGILEGSVFKGEEPAAGQTVTAIRLAPPRVRKEAVTDAEGRYRIAGVDSGLVEVLAKWREEGKESSPLRLSQQAEIVPGQATTVDFHFPEAFATLEGSITANGQPVKFAEIKVTVNSAEGQSQSGATAGEDGNFLLENLFPGTAWMEVSARAGQAELRKNLEVALAAGETAHQEIAFETSSGVSGTVSNLQEGEVGQVSVFPGHVDVDTSTYDSILALDAVKAGESDIDAEGVFLIEGLEPGPYTAVALVFSGESDTGDQALDSIRVGAQFIAVPASGLAQVSLSLEP
ncbi:MAG: carboxypeptidase regulatory-like domain-containing protein [Candidatus Hydrogenedentes bacterium]|nr:carboxypeptidase regulatory-like domain-containing protein [Candidatus Hydrogenedentota bacterium]